MTSPLKALEAIEFLVSGDFGEEMELLLYDKKNNVDPILRQAAQIISDIYLIAHAETKHTCKHPDWKTKKSEVLKIARINNLI